MKSVGSSSGVDSEPLIRGWQFHYYDMSYLRRAIDRAPQFKVNHIQLSHDVVMYLRHITHEPTRRYHINELVDRAHRHGMEAHIWVHAISYLQTEFLVGHRANLDDPRVWAYEEEQYRAAFRLCPDVDGIILSFGDCCHYHIYNDNQVVSSLSKSERILRYIQLVYSVCEPLGKSLYVRDWAGGDATVEAIRRSPPAVRVMTKTDIGDFQQTDPHNPLLGTFGDRAQIVEFDLCGEYLGRAWVPWCSPEYIAYRWQHAAKLGVRGAVGRVDVFDLGHHLDCAPYGVASPAGGSHALDSPNEINLFTFARLLEHPDSSPEVIWKEWTSSRYGDKASPYVTAALRRTFEIADRLFWSRPYVGTVKVIPSLGFLERVARSDGVLGRSVQDFETEGTLDAILDAEYSRAEALCRQSLDDLSAAQPFLVPADYAALVEGFRRYLDYAAGWRQVYRAFIRYKVLELTGRPAHHELLSVELQRLLDLAESIEGRAGPNAWPANPAHLRRFANEVREVTNYFQKQRLREPGPGLDISLFVPR